MTIKDTFLFAFNAVMPIILLILLGYILKQIKFFSDDFVKTANKLVFKAALPTLLFYNVYNISDLGDIDKSIVLFSLAVILFLFITGFICSLFIKDDKQKGVIWQSFFRSNFAIIGLPLSESLGGTAGLQTASILSAFSIPVFNIMAVIALSVFTSSDGKKKINIKEILIKIIKNPLIIGVFIGIVVLAIRRIIPTENGIPIFTIKTSMPFLYSAVGSVSKLASPLALIALGGQFKFSAVKPLWKQITLGTFIRIIFAPLAGLTAAVLMTKNTNLVNFTAAQYAAFIALFGSPIAVSSAIMASQMDNDEQLAGQLLVWTSIFSVFTIFITVVVMRSLALL